MNGSCRRKIGVVNSCVNARPIEHDIYIKQSNYVNIQFYVKDQTNGAAINWDDARLNVSIWRLEPVFWTFNYWIWLTYS